jgi:apolipoprotein N-acyltransferase
MASRIDDFREGLQANRVRRNYYPIGAAVLSGVLLALSFVPWNLGMMAWIAWIPLLIYVLPTDPAQSCPHPFRLGFITGWVFWLMTIYWLVHVTVLGMIALTAYLALYFGVWTYGLAYFRKRWPQPTGPHHLLLAFLGAASWIALEKIRSWMLTGFPWNFMGVSQVQNLSLIQIAEYAGVYGLSFLILFVNLSLWHTWRRLKAERFSPRSWRYEFSVAMVLVAFCLLVGMRAIFRWQGRLDPNQPTVKFALIQPNIPQEVKYEPMTQDDQRKRLKDLTKSSLAGKPDLIIWPETALVDGPLYHTESRYWLLQLLEEIQVPLLLGTLNASGDPSIDGGQRKHYNAALIVQPDGGFGLPYHKVHMVPFGEYVPLERWLPWMKWLTPIPASFDRGNRMVLFDFKGLKLGTLICFEDTFAYLARDLKSKGADVLINLTNDAWFKESHEAQMHAANSMLRAIETRSFLVRCTNHGDSLLVNPLGQIPIRMQPFEQALGWVSIPSNFHSEPTFYVKYGDWLPLGCLGIVVLVSGFLIWKTPKTPA